MRATIIACMLLAGCHTVRTVTVDRPVTVEVPVTTPCVRSSTIPAAPVITDNRDLALMPDDQFVLSVTKDREALILDNAVLRSIIKTCTTKE